MALDPILNFAKGTVSTGYDDADVTIVLESGHGANFPSSFSYNVVWWNSTDYADPSDDPNVEIVRVTGRSTDTLTVTRAQESTAASTKNTASKTYRMVNAFTKKMKDDMEALINHPEYRHGLNCKQASTTTITVEGGTINVDGTLVTKTTDTTLTLTTATDWVDDTTDQAVSTYGYIYINASGKIEMDAVAPDESDTSGNTSGILRYNDTGTDTSDRRMIGWFYMNATGAGELNSYEVGNLKDGDVHNSVVRTDSTQDAVNDTTYGVDLTNTQVHFYNSGRGLVNIKCQISGTVSTTVQLEAILNDGTDIAASENGINSVNTTANQGLTVHHAEAYAQGVFTFEAKAKVNTSTWTVEEKTMIITEN